MKEIIKNNSKFIIVMLLAIILGIVGVTVAVKIADFNPIAINTTTSNISANITYDSTNTSTVTSNGKMLPIKDSLVTGTSVTDARVLKVKFMVSGKSNNPSNSIYDIALRNITMDNTLKDSNVKWRLYKNNTLLSSGDFSPGFDAMNNNRLVLTETQQDLTTSTDTYVFLMWISETCTGDLTSCTSNDDQSKYLNKTFSFNIKLEAATKTKKDLTRDKSVLATYISNLYNSSTKTTVVNNNIKYQYDTTDSLMKDIGGNIRYYGASPNNYIYFNCSDYSNQSSSTCETWRIIGVFDGKLKLIRNESIGEYSWDNKDTSTGAESDDGKNDWTNARLMKLLNPGYESEPNGGSLYYTSKSGTCYVNSNNATTACDFTSTGIKNDLTRNMISDNTYSLLGWNDGLVYSDQIYEYERSTGEVYSGRPTLWTGKIAIAYLSDYGYAGDLGKCTEELDFYAASTCSSNNWMKSILGASSYGWLLTPDSSYSSGAWSVDWSGLISGGYTNDVSEVTPVLYLNSDASVKAGNGTSSNPYQISV